MILQAGAWPLTSPAQFSSPPATSQKMDVEEEGYAPPKSLQDSIKRFEEFYSENHSGRRLAWLYANSTADVKLSYLDKTYIAWMGAYQVSILLAFSNADSLTVAVGLYRETMA